jgi:hypothetical protein
VRTQQPEWVFIGNLGDADPLEHGGYFVYRDRTGVYEDEAEMLSPTVDGDYTVHRFILDRYKALGDDLVPYEWYRGWPHPAKDYRPWFQDSLPAAARSAGVGIDDLFEFLVSADPMRRAEAHKIIAEHHGWEEMDADPLVGLSRSEVERRYAEEIETGWRPSPYVPTRLRGPKPRIPREERGLFPR